MAIDRRAVLGSLPCLLAAGAARAEGADAGPEADAPDPEGISLEPVRLEGDLDAILERRLLRVLVPYSRSLFFETRGRLEGVTVHVVRQLEDAANRHLRTASRPLTIAIVPTPRGQLIERLRAGYGEAAAGNVTVTTDRAALVDFLDYRSATREVVVTGKGADPVATPQDLSGREIAVPEGSAYRATLEALNVELAALGRLPVRVTVLPTDLEIEDAIEMVGAGLLPAVVADDQIALLWVDILDEAVTVQPAVLAAREISWMVRKDTPRLKGALENAFRTIFGADPNRSGNLRSYLRGLPKLHAAAARSELERFQATLRLFETYAARYGFDPLMVMAQSYQESRLDQAARSPVGAIGLMQLMPATGRELGVGDIRQSEFNVHAGVRYMRQILDVHFADIPLDDRNRHLFAFAAYNAGPNRIKRLRLEAGKQGLDPNAWFGNVEHVVARRVGSEPVKYVRNIYKYYVAYRLLEQREAEAQAASRSLRAPEPAPAR